MGQRRAEQQEGWRVEEALFDDAWTDDGALHRDMGGGVVGLAGAAEIGQPPGGVEAGEIRGVRLLRAERAVGAGNDEGETANLQQQRDADETGKVGGQEGVRAACGPGDCTVGLAWGRKSGWRPRSDKMRGEAVLLASAPGHLHRHCDKAGDQQRRGTS